MSKIENGNARLKTARMAAGFKTATEFCEKFNIPISTYNMHETGKRKIMSAVAEKYSELLGINPAWLITGIGSPYSSENIQDTSDLTENEYLELLNYSGNKKIFKQPIHSTETLGNINPTLFSKIIIEIIDTLKSYNILTDLNFVTHHAVEIYKDIIQATNTPKDQLTMVSLAITIFKRQLQQTTQEDNLKVVNK